MHTLFLSSLLFILFFCIISVYLMKRSRVSMFYLAINANLFVYIISIYSLLFSTQVIYFRLTFAAACLGNLFIYALLKELAHHSFDGVDKVFAGLTGLVAFVSVLTPYMVTSFQQVEPLTFGYLNILQSFKLSYGFLYPIVGGLLAYVFFRALFLCRVYLKTTHNKRPVMYSLGSLTLLFLLTFISNFLYPMVFGTSKYSFMVVVWSLFLCIGNFIAISKYQYLNIRLVFSKSLLFLFCWTGLFSGLYVFGMILFLGRNHPFEWISFSCVLLFFVFIYQSTRDIFSKLMKDVLGEVTNNLQDFYMVISKDILDAKHYSHIFNSIKKLIDFFEGDQMVGALMFENGPQYTFNDHMSPPYFDHCLSKANQSGDMVDIYVDDEFVFLIFNLIKDNQKYGWFHARLPIYKHEWLRRQQPVLANILASCIHSMALIGSYESINTKIKYLTNSNEFVSRLSLTSINTLSTMILYQLKKIFGFEHVILPEFSRYNMEWSSSTVYVPVNIRHIINDLDLFAYFSFSYDPIYFNCSEPETISGLSEVCEFYQCEECYLLPIVQDDRLIGYYLGFSKKKNQLLEVSLLSIINKQISSILYRSITSHRIASIKRFYQEIIDHYSSIVVVLREDFSIEFSNRYFQTFFEKNYQSFNELIFDYPALDIIHKIIDFSDTELTLELKQHHFKLSLKNLGDNKIIVLLTNVTDLVKIQHSISKSSKLRGMGAFVAGVAHEIKNPLVAVKTFTQLISKDWTSDEIRQKCQTIVLPQLHRINNLSESLNYFGKNDSTSFQPINLSELILNSKELVMARLDGQTQIEFDLEPNIMIFANHSTLEQVFLNLLLNAIDAVETVKNPQIKFRLFTDVTTKVVLDIIDNGVGISSENVHHLFDPFFTTKDTGTGLGLSIVHQIILDHQGSISILETGEFGTTFRLVFPKLLRPKVNSGVRHDD